MSRGHQAALLDRVVEQGQRRGGAERAADLKAHRLEHAGHAVALGRRRRKRQVHHAEGHAQPAGGLLRDKLAHARDAEGGFLDGFGHDVEGLTLHALQRVVHDARAGNAHVYDAFRLAHAGDGAGHEGVVLHGVGKDDELGAAEAAGVGGHFRGLFDDAAHEGDGVHVDAGAGTGHVDA